MIGFAPIEEPPRVRKRVLREEVVKKFQHERTECNYLVLFFVIGVMLLAFGDATRR